MKRLFAFLVIPAVLSLSVVCVGAPLITVDSDVDNGIVNIEVSGKANTLAGVRVTNTDGKLIFSDVGKTDAGGAAAFRYVNKGLSGEYTIFANIENETASEAFAFVSFANDVLIPVNDAINSGTWAPIKDVLIESHAALGINLAPWNDLAEANKTKVFERFIENSGEIKTATEIKDRFYKSLMLTYLHDEPNAGKINAFLENIDMEIPVDKTGKSVFKQMQTALRLKVVEKALSVSVGTAEEFYGRMVLCTLTEGVSQANNWSDVEPLLKSYQTAELLDISFSSYQNLTDTSAVMKSMLNTDYTSYKSVADKFSLTVEAQRLQETTSPSAKGSGSGSGAKSGGSGGVVVTVAANPEADTNTAVTTPALTPAASKFKDMQDAQWAETAVYYLVDRGIVAGVTEDTFEAARPVTRFELSKLLTLATELQIGTSAEITFDDVPDGHWASEYVAILSAAGIITGVGEGRFEGNRSVTREEAAVMLGRAIALLLPGGKSESAARFMDEDDISAWAVEDVKGLASYKIIKGDTENCFNPQSQLTRAEAAQIIYNMLMVTG